MLFQKKGEQEEKEPQYYESATKMQTLNYKVYYMSSVEKILYSLLGFAVGAAVGYIFYGGIGSDEFGDPTAITRVLNIVIPAITGIIAARIFLPIRTKQIINKRKRTLNLQFRDMLEGLNTSFGSGKNVPDAFAAVLEDMKMQYEEGAFIVDELEIIQNGLLNNIPLEDMLDDFSVRSGNIDVKSFADVFRVSYRKGGNMKDIIKKTHSILSDKMDVLEEIETAVAASKMEQNLILVMPVAIVAMIKFSSTDFAANFTSGSGLVSTTIAVVLFVVAYLLGKKILDIKI